MLQELHEFRADVVDLTLWMRKIEAGLYANIASLPCHMPQIHLSRGDFTCIIRIYTNAWQLRQINSRAVTANGRDVNHSISKLNKRSSIQCTIRLVFTRPIIDLETSPPLFGNIQFGNVLEDKVGQYLVPVFTKVRNEGLRRELVSKTVGS